MTTPMSTITPPRGGQREDRSMLVIVACGQRKQQRKRPAHELYTGPYFRATLAYAQALVGKGGWRQVLILSAQYGLVGLTDWIEPYDTTLARGRQAWTGQVKSADVLARVRQQVTERQLQPERVIVLGGRQYAELVREIWPQAEWPTRGRGGIGKQIAWLWRQAREHGVR